MIKKLIGILLAVAVIVIIVVAAIRRDNFRTMVLRDEIMNQDFPAPETAEPLPVIDSVKVVVNDSIR